MLILTLRDEYSGVSVDIQVNPQQRVADTLQILQEAGKLWNIEWRQRKVKSLREGIFLNVQQNYEEGNIYTGDILDLV